MSGEQSQPLISIIIRNRNEAHFLRFVLESIKQQKFVITETIVVDNESEDASLAIAREYNCQILTIPKNSFSYGKALNVGMQAATGEICILLSAHSMLVGPFALYACIEAFSDPSVAAARFLLVGKRFDVKRWIEPEYLDDHTDIDAVVSKGPLANGCAIRRAVWVELPFNEALAAAEEKIWALAALRKGYKIYSPCPTAYCYLKDLALGNRIKKNNRELQTVFEETGVRLDHLRNGIARKLKNAVVGISTQPFLSIYRIATTLFLESSLLLSVRKKTERPDDN